VREPQARRHLARDDDTLVVDRDDRVEREAPVEVPDGLGGGVDVVEGHQHRVRAVVADHLRLLRSDDHVEAQPAGRGEEVTGPVGSGGQKEENAGHGPIMATMVQNGAVEPLLTVSDRAREKVLEVRAAEPEPDGLALWLDVNGVSGTTYTYDMYFQRADEAGPDDAVVSHDDLTVVVPSASVDKIRGATLDLQGGGMVLQNPNRPPASPAISGRPAGDLTGEVPQRVLQVLEEQINPSIASHGGRADLVAVEESVAYLRLSGGCQGCGLASVTLSQGIEVAILDAVPEITRVVDVTDHASGENPYFESAKK
jgi:Fe/S biogenesis protein NfuA